MDFDGLDAFLQVGAGGHGTLTIDDGGSARVAFMNVGRNAGGSGNLTLSGAGSRLLIEGEPRPNAGGLVEAAFFTVGRFGQGEMQVLDGAKAVVTSDDYYPGFQVGRNQGGNGALLVSGAGSEILVDSALVEDPVNDPFHFHDGVEGWIAVGRSGNGTLTVADGGRVVNDDKGSFYVGGYTANGEPAGNGSIVLAGAGSTLDAGRHLYIGADPFAPVDLFGRGAFAQSSGGSGDVSVRDGATLTADNVWIGGGGRLAGDGGTVDGDVFAFDGGVIAPGDSPGDMVFLGDVDLSAGGILEIEIAGTGDGEFDRLFFGGSVNLAGGEIVFSFLGGLAPDLLENVFDVTSFLRTGTDPATATGIDLALLGGVGFSAVAPGFDPAEVGFDPSTGAFAVTAAGVPEPATLALLGAGLAAAGGAARRRQRVRR